ncbi:DegV family protein [Chloroflexota bacterium]
MSVKIVTDSTSDISPEVARALGITVVPAYIRFDHEVYRDGVDMSDEAFYQKLRTSFVHPTSSQPTPQDFARVYSDCSKGAEDIISIHIAANISNTYNSALQGKKMAKGKCRIEVIDSHFVSVGTALVVMAAARLAKSGEKLQSILEETQKATKQIGMLGILDTMKYLVMGGRISKTTAAVANIFQIKPLLTFRNGEIVRDGLVRTYLKGIDRLYEFVGSNHSIQDLAIAHSTTPGQANELKKRLSSIFPEEKIYVAQLGAALGVHGGPGALFVALRRGE